MGSRKGSAKARQVADFKSSLYGADGIGGFGGIGDAFSREQQRRDEAAREREEYKRTKACASKNRYQTRGEAEAAILSCADYGTTGLKAYKCSYCNGWHLTSHPWDA